MDLEGHPELELRPPADPAALEAARRELGDLLPDELAALLAMHDGGEGFVGENYLMLSSVAKIVEDHRDQDELAPYAGWLVFASNGGGEAFAFDDEGVVQMVPWIAGREDAIAQGRLDRFLERLEADELFDE
jgi:cell wall assembly regulator SMI1